MWPLHPKKWTDISRLFCARKMISAMRIKAVTTTATQNEAARVRSTGGRVVAGGVWVASGVVLGAVVGAAVPSSG
jgi:hypothetical protein